MSYKLRFSLLAIALGAIALTPTATAQTNETRFVCHRTNHDDPRYRLIAPNDAAYDNHMSHGDEDAGSVTVLPPRYGWGCEDVP